VLTAKVASSGRRLPLTCGRSWHKGRDGCRAMLELVPAFGRDAQQGPLRRRRDLWTAIWPVRRAIGMAGHRAELWHTIYAPHTNAVGQLVSGPGDILLLRHNATLPQQPGRPSSRRQADCRNRHWTDRWHRPLIRSRSGWRSAHWRANPLIGRNQTLPSAAGCARGVRAGSTVAFAVDRHGWRRTSQGSRAAAAAPP